MFQAPTILRTAALLAAAVTTAHGYIGFTYNNCVAPGHSVSSTYAAGDKIPLCLHFNGNVTAAFTTTVDRYDAISVAGSNYALPANSGYVQHHVGPISESELPQTDTCEANMTTTTLYVTFDVSVLDSHSPVPRIYKTIELNPCLYGNGSQITTVPLYTVIVSLNQGKVDYVSFDDGCFFCASNGDECIPTALDLNGSLPITDNPDLVGCEQDAEFCYPVATDASNSTDTNSTVTSVPQSTCDLKLFIVWTGTDSRGQYLTSAGRRFSRFRQYGTASAYQSGLNLLADAKDLALTAVDIATRIPGRVVPERELRASGGAVSELDAIVAAGYREPQQLPIPA